MLKVNCPTCDTDVVWCKENTFKPFCSERCKMVDLGEWAEEAKVIKGQSLHQATSGKIDEFDLEEELSKFTPNSDNFFLDE